MKPAIPFILTINGCSSRIKFALYRIGESLERGLHGRVDRIGSGATGKESMLIDWFIRVPKPTVNIADIRRKYHQAVVEEKSAK
jgi:hypothetical protein